MADDYKDAQFPTERECNDGLQISTEECFNKWCFKGADSRKPHVVGGI